MSILLLGKSGYVGQAFVRECSERGASSTWLSRSFLDYTNEKELRSYLSVSRHDTLISAAAFIPTPSVDLCKDHKPETWRANVHLPVMLARMCQELGITFCHISTACLYDDKKEYTESDFPTRLGDGYCSFYLNTKYFAETLVRDICEKHYIWRIRLPFDEFDHPKNYLTKLRSFKTVWEQTNSLTHRGDFVKSALDMIAKKAPWGTYSMVNKESMRASDIWDAMAEHKVLPNEGGTGHWAFTRVKGPVSGSILSTAKLEATGCGMRPVAEAVEEALENWRKE